MDILIYGLAGFFAIAFTIKMGVLFWIFVVKKEPLPDDMSGPVSGWGTADD